MENDNIFIDTKLDIRYKRIFYKIRVEPSELNEFKIKNNNFLQSEITGFYHTDYKYYEIVFKFSFLIKRILFINK